jgi:hypothetical protein
LSGVYCTEPDAQGLSQWMVLDPRGYYTDTTPTCECDLDLEALCLFNTASIGRYKVADGQIEMQLAKPDAPVAKSAFKQDGEKLTIGERTYHRVDGARPISGMNGKYIVKGGEEALYFTPDGRFSTESIAAAQAAKNADLDREQCVENPPVPANPGSSGSYRLENDRLLLWNEDGRKLCKPYFEAPGEGARVFIAGKLYVKE